MWNSQNNISLLLNVGKYRSLGSVVRVAYDMDGYGSVGLKLIETCARWLPTISDDLKKSIDNQAQKLIDVG